MVSMSWGGSEFFSFNGSEFTGETQDDYHFTTPSGHTGVTFVASAGDSGTFSGVEWPAVSPNVVIGWGNQPVHQRGRVIRGGIFLAGNQRRVQPNRTDPLVPKRGRSIRHTKLARCFVRRRSQYWSSGLRFGTTTMAMSAGRWLGAPALHRSGPRWWRSPIRAVRCLALARSMARPKPCQFSIVSTPRRAPTTIPLIQRFSTT